jgi:ABC-type polysaccharide/polyol phosphate transport system ATPase subunit
MICKAQLIVMVSHDLDSIIRLCDKVLWMDHGRVRQLGPTEEIVAAYKKSVGAASGQQAA